MMVDEMLLKTILLEREQQIARERLHRQAAQVQESEPQGSADRRSRIAAVRSTRPQDHAVREMMTMKATELALHIEHAVLNPEASEQDVTEAARIVLRWGVRALVVKPCYVPLAAGLLANSAVKVVTVIGFPHGGQTTATKVQETRQAVADGAQEVDMVLNIGALRSHQTSAVFSEIYAVVNAAAGRPVKVILETAYLTDAQKRLACRLAARAGAMYVKTSTGFGPRGARSADVALMRRIVGRSMGIKAAGGIRSYTDALALMQAGADLLGTSATDAILREVASEAAA